MSVLPYASSIKPGMEIADHHNDSLIPLANIKAIQDLNSSLQEDDPTKLDSWGQILKRFT